ncbi:MAG: glycosyltransferase family 4 protein [Planctomycetaceae bacterium]|nr:glycosyltransferase family 4 protein [Planctomycetaceae bacterium]
MRVAHLITRMIIGGAQENTLLNCLDLVAQYGDEVLLVTGPPVGPEGDLLALGQPAEGRAGEGDGAIAGFPVQPLRFAHLGGEVELPVVTVPSLVRAIRPGTDWRASGDLAQILRAYKPDVVHTHSAKAGILGRLAAWSLKVPAIVHTVHGAPFGPFEPWARRTFYQWCERYAASRCHHLISVADAMTDLMVSAHVAPREKFTTIYSGMSVEPFLAADENRAATRGELGFAPEHVVVGKIARLFHLKGHEDIVTAAMYLDREPNLRFLFVGDGILRDKLQKMIDDAGLADRFRFTGLVRPDRIPALIGAMDILVHASRREGLARALPQALIAGKPVVSYDVDGAREVCIDNETGFLVRSGHFKDLCEPLLTLARDGALRERMGQEGRRRFTDQFRHETMTRRIRELYGRLLAG